MSEILHKVYQRNANHPWQTLNESTVILSTQGMMSYELQGIGHYIWESLDSQKSVSEIIQSILLEYDASQDQATKDTLEFITTLEDENLITCTNS